MTLPSPDEWPTDRPLAALWDGRLPDSLEARADQTPERTAIIDADSGDVWSYAELDRAVDELAAGLRSGLGFDRGRVGVVLETRRRAASAFFATVRAGGSAVLLNVELDPETLAAQAERAGIDALLCERDTERLAREINPDDVPIGSLDDPGSDDIREIGRRDGRAISRATTGPDAERLVVFTSGTTGEPKGVRLTAENLVASAVGSAARLGVDSGDRWLAVLPTYHVGGLAPFFRSTLYGTTVVVQQSFDASATAEALSTFDATGVSLVPTMLTRLLDDGWGPPDPLRFVLLGGAPASEGLIERCGRRGVPACPTYGLTETASQVATARPAEARSRPGTVGRPIETADVTILPPGDGEDGEPCDPGETGELVVDGPVVTPGYLDDRNTRAPFGSNGLHTGDLGYRDADGRLWIEGRVDDRIVTGGENVDPVRVADEMANLDGVTEAAVVGLPDEEWGERVAALVVPDDGSDGGLTGDAIRAALRGSLADYELPRTVAFVDRLPRTPSGTVDREAVRDRLTD